MPYTWVTSYVAGDKIYCVHEAEDAETILEHARRGGFPADLVSVVANEFGPHTAERRSPVRRLATGRSRSARLGPTLQPVDLLERDRELGAPRRRPRRSRRRPGCRRRGRRRLRRRQVRAASRPRVAARRRPRGSCAAPATRCSTPRPLGPFRDLAGAGRPRGLLGGEDVLLSEVCEQVYDALRAEPTVLVVEDLHWVDAASVDVLRFLARRVESMPLALLVTYRDHEIGPRHSARLAARRLRRLDGLTTLALRPLSRRRRRARWSTAPGSTPSAVHAVTGGNPFFVTEVAKEPDRPLPASVRDAVLGPHRRRRPRRLRGAPARRDRPRPARRPGAAGARRRPADPAPARRDRRCSPAPRGGLVFRHELARQAVESTIPPGGGPRLHARLLDALERIEPRDPAVLTHHAVAARDSGPRRGVRREPRPRRRSAPARTPRRRRSSRPRWSTSTTPPPGERAELLLQLAYQQYMTSRLARGDRQRRAPRFPLWQRGRRRRRARRGARGGARSTSTTTPGAARPRTTADRGGRPIAPDAGAQPGRSGAPAPPGATSPTCAATTTSPSTATQDADADRATRPRGDPGAARPVIATPTALADR